MASDLITAVEAIRENADRYKLAGDYYDGKVGELFTSEAVRRALRNAAGGFDINLARRPVDAVLDRVQILAVAVPKDEAATRRLIDTVWVPNRMDRYSKQVHWAALTFGDGYLIAWPGDAEGSVELHYNSPVTTRMFYDPENARVKSHAAKMWTMGSGDAAVTRVNLYYADRIEKWTTKPGNPGKEHADFTEYEVDGEVWPLPNPYGQVPVFHFRTSEPYGRPEHR
ncbi:MAG: phage portal protein, partial [Micromonosporaceae bacterium]